jgi:hypothetical protein
MKKTEMKNEEEKVNEGKDFKKRRKEEEDKKQKKEERGRRRSTVKKKEEDEKKKPPHLGLVGSLCRIDLVGMIGKTRAIVALFEGARAGVWVR